MIDVMLAKKLAYQCVLDSHMQCLGFSERPSEMCPGASDPTRAVHSHQRASKEPGRGRLRSEAHIGV